MGDCLGLDFGSNLRFDFRFDFDFNFGPGLGFGLGRGLGLAYIGIEDGGRVEGMRRAQRGADACSSLACWDVAMLRSRVFCHLIQPRRMSPRLCSAMSDLRLRARILSFIVGVVAVYYRKGYGPVHVDEGLVAHYNSRKEIFSSAGRDKRTRASR